MNRQQAEKLIEDTFTQKFDTDQFAKFILNLVNHYDTSKERSWSSGQIYQDFKEHIAAYKRVGLYTDPNGEEVEILLVRTHYFSKLERARTSLRNFVVKWLQSEENKERARDYALVAFYSKEDDGIDWRFSFIKIEVETFLTERKRAGIRTVLSPAKRYSYLVGEHEDSYTARIQLLPLLERDYANPTVEELEAAFGIEKVTDEFFEQYALLYRTLVERLKQEPAAQAILTTDKARERFTKKLLGQIVFLYFIELI